VEAAKSGEALNNILAEVDKVAVEVSRVEASSQTQSNTVGEMSAGLIDVAANVRHSAEVIVANVETISQLDGFASE
jgi:methyl-accepting chemotaxis protein